MVTDTLAKHRLLNDLIGVYKKNFPSERNVLNVEQKALANKIRQLSLSVQNEHVETEYFHNGLTTILVKSKMN